METLSIDTLSKRQLSRLKNGHSVRVKSGKSHPILISAKSHKKAMNTFKKSKGMNLKLTKEEVEANLIKGEGFWGKIRHAFKKVASNPVVKEVARSVQPLVKQGINTAISAGTDAILAEAPELAPVLLPASAKLSQEAQKSYGNIGRSKKKSAPAPAPVAPRLAKRKNIDLQYPNSRVRYTTQGTKRPSSSASSSSNKRQKFTIPELESMLMKARMESGFTGRVPTFSPSSGVDDEILGNGLYLSPPRGAGLYVGRGIGESAPVGKYGNFVNSKHQALATQPYFANPAWRSTLPL